MWTSEQHQRLALEHRLLQQEGFGQFSVYWDQARQTYHAEGIATTNSGRKYNLYLVIPTNFPYERPSLYITAPSPLYTYSGSQLTAIGVSHDMHTLAPSNGCVQICHWRDARWHSSILLYRVFLKGLIWLEAYEQHLATGRPLAEFVTTMTGVL